MESRIKQKLGADKLNELAQHAFGLNVADAVELKDGWANTAYRMELEDGRKTVLKISAPRGVQLMRYERDMMRAEVESMRLVADKLPVPAIYLYDPSGERIGSEYFFMEYLDGSPFDKVKGAMEPGERAVIQRELGQLNRRLNDIAGTWYGPYASSGSYGSSWPEVFLRMLEDVLADGRDAGLKLPVADSEMLRLADEHHGILSEVDTPRLVHWDLWDGNVFVRDGAIMGILDFERALWGDPMMEAYFGRTTCTEAFLEGYGLPQLTEAEKARRRLYDLYLDLILVIECDYRGYDNVKHMNWARENLIHGWELLRGSVG